MILGFVGAKMLLAEWVHVPVLASLAVIGVILAVTIGLSLHKNKNKSSCPMPKED